MSIIEAYTVRMADSFLACILSGFDFLTRK